MIDIAVVAALIAVTVRGWYRGLVLEAVDLAVLVFGLLVGFRVSGPLGGFLAAWMGISLAAGTVVGGSIAFFAVAVAGKLVVRFARFALPHLSGAPALNRAAGATLGAAWGMVVITLIVSLIAVLPLGDAAVREVDNSSISAVLIDPDGTAQTTMAVVIGDPVLRVLLGLRKVIGPGQVIVEGSQRLELPAADPADLAHDRESAMLIFDELNRSRVEAGLEPLAWSVILTDVGVAHATEMYTDGYFAHESLVTGTVEDRLEDADIPYVIVGENLALAVNAGSTHAGLMGSSGHRANILSPHFIWVGIGVVEGPLGLMTVQVFLG